ncbi:MAG TPA: hypothetical protein VI636_12520 [Candidatus Angelobacter sp.]
MDAKAVFVDRGHTSGYHMTFIDQHYCFDGERWSFPDLPLFGMYHHLHVYQNVAGWESFEPALSRIEQIDYAELWRCAAQIPHGLSTTAKAYLILWRLLIGDVRWCGISSSNSATRTTHRSRIGRTGLAAARCSAPQPFLRIF